MAENLTFWFRDVYAALRGFVSAAGGSKVIGPKLFPEKNAENAADWLDDCLNPDRKAKLDPEEFLLMLKLARQAGFHQLMEYVGDETDYNVAPREPKDELASLYSQFVGCTREMKQLAERIERVESRVKAGPRR